MEAEEKAKKPSKPKIEDKQVVAVELDLDLSQKKPDIQYGYTWGDPNPQEKSQATAAARERVSEMSKPYSDEGWELDGSFDPEVDVVWEDVEVGLRVKKRAKQARVKLRRNR